MTKEAKVDEQKYWDIEALKSYVFRYWGTVLFSTFIIFLIVFYPRWLSILLGFFLASILYFVVFYGLTLSEKRRKSENLDEYHPSLVGYVADDNANQIRLPMWCHKGDSHNVCLKVKPARAHESDHWEAELQAAGVKVLGEQTKQNPSSFPASPELLFFWNCNFETSGTLLVNLLLRTITIDGGCVKLALRTSHEIQVRTHFRHYSISLITVIVAVLGLLFTLHLDMTSVLQSLGF